MIRLTLQAVFAGVIAVLMWPIALAAGDDIDVRVARMDDGYHISAFASVRAPVERAWAVLTDFNRLAEFVPDMRSSRVVSPDGQPILVEQHGIAQALLFSHDVTVTLAITLSPMARIQFRSIEGNLRSLSGEWRLQRGVDGCRIAYTAVSDPAFWTPPLIGSALVRSQVREQIQSVVNEIESNPRGR